MTGITDDRDGGDDANGNGERWEWRQLKERWGIQTEAVETLRSLLLFSTFVSSSLSKFYGFLVASFQGKNKKKVQHNLFHFTN